MYKRKTDRGRADHEQIMTAVRKVVDTGLPCRNVADEHGIPHCTLRRYCIKYRSNGGDGDMRTGYFNAQSVLSIDEEQLLVDYVQRAAALYYRLNTMEMRRLAYDYAKKLEKKMPNSWASNEKAGVDWLTGFLKRHSITDAGSDVSPTCHEFQQGERRLIQRQLRAAVPTRGIDAS